MPTLALSGAEQLVPNKIYGYRLVFTLVAGAKETLSSLHLLDGAAGLGYADGNLPTFSLAPALKDLNFIHGSCRKPHAGGRDALAIVDDLIRDDLQDPMKRPHYLFHTGDQIYADDVAVSLAAILGPTGNDLLGWAVPEWMPKSTTTGVVLSTDPTVKPGTAREKFIREQTKLTSDLVRGHLMFLADYFAMYALTWSDALWPRNASGAYDLPTADEVLAPGTSESNLIDPRDDRLRTLEFASNVPKVRRALANVPNYMMFDDHDVTDDWNLHRKWDEDARSSPTQLRIIRNALLAYAVFQAWGNDPSWFLAQPALQLLDALTFTAAGGDPPIQAQAGLCDDVLDIKATGALPSRSPNRNYWSYGFPGPDFQVITLDTRTRRAFPPVPAMPKANVSLMSDDAMDELVQSFPPVGSDFVTILVSPAPVFGNPFAEEVQQGDLRKINRGAAPGMGRGEEIDDNEAWSGNRAAFERFIGTIRGFQRAVILSGDVHHAFTNSVAYFADYDNPPTTARFVQLCSSALKNESGTTYLAMGLGYGDPFGGTRMRGMGWFGFNQNLSQTNLYDTLRASLKNSINLQDPGAQQLVGLILRIEERDRFKKPAVLPTNGWPLPAGQQTMRNLLGPPIGPPGWQYNVTYATDQRDAAAQQAANAGLRQFLAANDKTPEGQRVRTFVFDIGRAIVGMNNVGRVRFRFQGQTPKEVVHQLYWSLSGPDGLPSTWTAPGGDVRAAFGMREHVASLARPVGADRPTVGP